jgi:hypothetical protein
VRDGGAERDRTDDLLLAKQALSQLSYSPVRNRFALAVERMRRRRTEGRSAEDGMTGLEKVPAPVLSNENHQIPRNGGSEAMTGGFLRKEVIQPQVPLRLPCYDFTPVADLTVVGCLLAVSAPASGKTNSHGVTGGVYKARERIHRGMLIRDY